MKENVLYRWLMFWTLFIGFGAVIGFSMMMIDPSGRLWGLDAALPLLQELPWSDVFFNDFIWSGIVLLCVNGFTQLTGAYLLFRESDGALPVILISSLLLLVWILFEWLIWGFAFLSNLYFIFGLLECGMCIWYRRLYGKVVHSTAVKGEQSRSGL